MKHKSRKAIFTFVAIAAVSLILAITWRGLHERTSRSTAFCVINLHALELQKDVWAKYYDKATNDIPAWSDLRLLFPSNNIPICPSGGSYQLNAVGELPTCSIGGPRHSIHYSHPAASRADETVSPR